MRGLAAAHPLLAATFGLAVLALLGFPPAALFASELGIARAGATAGLGWAVAAAFLLALLAFAAITAGTGRMLLGPPPDTGQRPCAPTAHHRWPRPPHCSRPARGGRARHHHPAHSPGCSTPPPPSSEHHDHHTTAIGRRTVGHNRVAVDTTAADLPGHVAALTARITGSRWSPAHDDHHDAAARRLPVHRRRPGPADRTAPAPRPRSADRAEPGRPVVSGRPVRTRMHDLYGIVPDGHPLPRRLVRHPHWPAGWYPMRHDAGPPPPFGRTDEPYPFLTVEGPGVYEIPVGPVHAGLIEPGHFRFSVVGETILKLKARLWYVHKGIEKLFEGRDRRGCHSAGRADLRRHRRRPHPGLLPRGRRRSAHRRPGRGQADARHPARAGARLQPHRRHRRAVQRRRPRHPARPRPADQGDSCCASTPTPPATGCFAAASTSAAPPSAPSPTPATSRRSPPTSAKSSTSRSTNSLVAERFTGTAILTTEQARDLGTLGYVARASGIDTDARRDHPTGVLHDYGLNLADMLTVRSRPAATSWPGSSNAPPNSTHRSPCSTPSCRTVSPGTSSGQPNAADPPPRGTVSGVGIVEGWRGTIVHRVELDPYRRLTRNKIVDPSFFNWPALPLALANTIVPDFPLANKSFNLSYAGNDL